MKYNVPISMWIKTLLLAVSLATNSIYAAAACGGGAGGGDKDSHDSDLARNARAKRRADTKKPAAKKQRINISDTAESCSGAGGGGGEARHSSSERSLGAGGAYLPAYDQKSCVICHDPLSNGSDLFVGSCRHALHFVCAKNLRDAKCPICRADINMPLRRSPSLIHAYGNAGGSLGGFGVAIPAWFNLVPMPPAVIIPAPVLHEPPLAQPALAPEALPTLSITALAEHRTVATTAETPASFLVRLTATSSAIADDPSNRQGTDLIAVIDVSGSMRDNNKLSNVQRSLIELLARLTKRDRLAIISFSDHGTIILPLTRMNPDGKESATFNINRLRADGGTSISSGLDLARTLVADTHRTYPDRLVTTILLSDGEDTRGFRADQSAIGCRIYTLGYGEDHKPELMRAIAETNENGLFSYVTTDASRAGEIGIATIENAFSNCLLHATAPTHGDVQLRMTAAAGVSFSGITSAYPITEDGTQTRTIALGPVQGGAQFDVFATVQLPAQEGSDIVIGYAEVSIPEAGGARRVLANIELRLNRTDAAAEPMQAEYRDARADFDNGMVLRNAADALAAGSSVDAVLMGLSTQADALQRTHTNTLQSSGAIDIAIGRLRTGRSDAPATMRAAGDTLARQSSRAPDNGGGGGGTGSSD